jgi:para-nitrobenzyl esterase
MPPPIGAPHACEIEYCMGNLDLVKDYAWTPDDYKVSETMLNFFANFIKTGNPNGEKLPEWPAAKAGDKNPPVMVLDTESKSVNMDDSRYYFQDKMSGNNK